MRCVSFPQLLSEDFTGLILTSVRKNRFHYDFTCRCIVLVSTPTTHARFFLWLVPFCFSPPFCIHIADYVYLETRNAASDVLSPPGTLAPPSLWKLHPSGSSPSASASCIHSNIPAFEKRETRMQGLSSEPGLFHWACSLLHIFLKML